MGQCQSGAATEVEQPVSKPEQNPEKVDEAERELCCTGAVASGEVEALPPAETVDQNPDERRAPKQVQICGPEEDLKTHDAEAHIEMRAPRAIAMCKIVSEFYAKVVADEELGPFYNGAPMERIKKKQETFCQFAFGGQELMEEGFSLRSIHTHLREQGLTLYHWEKFLVLFKETLVSLELREEDINTAMTVLYGTRSAFEPDSEDG